jgi:hypothetical protein
MEVRVAERKYLLTIIEPVTFVKETMRFNARPPIMDYKTIRFMTALLNAIFYAPTDDNRAVNYDYSEAEGILVEDGLGRLEATALTQRVMDELIDMIGEQLPYLAFNSSQKVHYLIQQEFDLLVAIEFRMVSEVNDSELP